MTLCYWESTSFWRRTPLFSFPSKKTKCNTSLTMIILEVVYYFYNTWNWVVTGFCIVGTARQLLNIVNTSVLKITSMVLTIDADGWCWQDSMVSYFRYVFSLSTQCLQSLQMYFLDFSTKNISLPEIMSGMEMGKKSFMTNLEPLFHLNLSPTIVIEVYLRFISQIGAGVIVK